MKKVQHGFSLVELLVVIAVIGLLAVLLAPGLMKARASALAGIGQSNLRELFTANSLYAAEKGHYVSASSDLFTSNLERWHGRREGMSDPFDGLKGPLAPYLRTKKVNHCPSFDFAGAKDSPNAFEASCGGYGYNMVGVGSLAYLGGFSASNLVRGMTPGSIQNPAQTVMFADTGFGQPYGNPDHIIEYSFAEPYFHLSGSGKESGVSQPSIHFRHNGFANVVWCDGHVTREPMMNAGNGKAGELMLGWLGETPGNELFDPY